MMHSKHLLILQFYILLNDALKTFIHFIVLHFI